MATTGADGTGAVETPSGKGAGDENFPVASRLIAPALRPCVMAFYTFARGADDVADNPALDPDDKIARLDAFEAGLDGQGTVAPALSLRDHLARHGVTDTHARDLLKAFRMDAHKGRYADWADLMGYCAVSANPVGRFLMDLHGEHRGLWPASDALCSALQVLNHLQDCQQDYRRMDRVYLPQEMLSEEGLGVDVLDAPRAAPGLRRVLDRLLDLTDELIARAADRPVRLTSRRLDAEMRVITGLARRLSARLRAADPVAGRVSLSRRDFALAAAGGALGALLR